MKIPDHEFYTCRFTGDEKMFLLGWEGALQNGGGEGGRGMLPKHKACFL